MRIPNISKIFTGGLSLSGTRAPIRSPNWRTRSVGRLEEASWLLTEEVQMGEPSLDRSTSLSKAEFQSHADALKERNEDFEAKSKDRYLWKVPYEWDPPNHGDTDRWLNALLYNPPKDMQRVWLIGDDKKGGFSHPLEDIPLVQRLLYLRQTGLVRPLKFQLLYFFERINQLNLERSNALQDASIVDFILALAAITEVNQRSKKLLHPISAMIEECILSEFMPGFEKKITESNRIDFKNLISVLRELWDDRRRET
ncbi:uncharacterized protein PGTG_10223 [Puccinia graminis f. sp. tritici CRL 75-36-700-3]|uniref:Uncharacterized protein n=1 Tax=Puccinia graminis f. sp. tritici (strain CRL 75-36-700-3 / race SCCL) TaxID=418459 RepID=E3KJM8_PUCGT|nr:uncharacterized protein PGTG_10223 [Puccinia graminis f. sp. tritici CRL 75-36-700-3]EFP84503.2 hypothetical protein PGTG_10223 [Puccinia graminis f. sp. tritici CRL 75-36-700-3]